MSETPMSGPRADETAEEYRQRLNDRFWPIVASSAAVGMLMLAGVNSEKESLWAIPLAIGGFICICSLAAYPLTGKQLAEKFQKRIASLNRARD